MPDLPDPGRGRLCGEVPMLEATLTEGTPPWSLTLSTPTGKPQQLSGLERRHLNSLVNVVSIRPGHPP